MTTTPREVDVMTAPAHGFKRLVLALQPGAGSADLRFPAEMARQLDLELLALVLDDLGLAEAARLPFTREFRGPASGWQPLDPGQIASDIQAAIENLRRSIEKAARELEGNARFEVLKGPLTETIRAVSRAGDILLLAEPVSPAQRASVQFNWLAEAVLGSSAAVLLVPARLARQKGPVVAIAAAEDDRSIQVAAEISASCGEKLVIIEEDQHEQPLAARAGDEHLGVERISVPHGALANPTLLHYAFRNLQERLIVIDRGTFDESVASTVASSRRVPVLLIKPS
jgi:hypothetical protein